VKERFLLSFEIRSACLGYHQVVAKKDKQRILVVEDEESLRDGLCDLLVFHGWQPSAAADGEHGLRLGLAEDFHLVLLDVMLPGISGFEVCERLRAAKKDLAILMLTAKGAEDDVVRGLRAGADDYVTKPFSLRELVARVEAQLRRTQRGLEPLLEIIGVGQWRIDPRKLLAEADDQKIELTPREVAILGVLARERGRVVSRRTLLEEVWGFRNVDDLETHTVEVHLAKLRAKLGGRVESPIQTVRGAGYRLAG
jgi:two-component system, OmpR family, response regulator RegX3